MHKFNICSFLEWDEEKDTENWVDNEDDIDIIHIWLLSSSLFVPFWKMFNTQTETEAEILYNVKHTHYPIQ